MATLFRNAILLDLDPVGVEAGELRVENGVIEGRGAKVVAREGDEVVDCGGAVVMPGLVNGHTHLYSALAVGMPGPPRVPKDFPEILSLVWWRLDRALDGGSNEVSALMGALEAVRCGTTTLIDHHASPNAIEGSLDRIEGGIGRVGLRGVLCYEVTDRNGAGGAEAGIEENGRYIRKCRVRRDGRFAGLVGAHASFTLSDETFAKVAELAGEMGVGVHIHVAEDRCDERHSVAVHGLPLIERLAKFGVVAPSSIFGHGTHLSDAAIARVNEVGVAMAHNTRSNMNNAVGYAPVGRLTTPVMLGTDGIGADLFSESKTAWFKSRDGHAGISPVDVIGMLNASARRASKELGVTLGKLVPGAAADVVVTDYRPFTPLGTENAAGHLLFALAAHHVKGVMVGGAWVMKDRVVMGVDETTVRRQAREVTGRLWARLNEIPE